MKQTFIAVCLCAVLGACAHATSHRMEVGPAPHEVGCPDDWAKRIWLAVVAALGGSFSTHCTLD